MALHPKVIELQQHPFVRYLVAAGTATLIDTFCYMLFFKGIEIEHLYSLILSYSIGLITNFLITKYYVFHASTLKTQTQFVRYLLIALLIFFANKFLMDYLYTFFPKETVTDWGAWAIRLFSAGCIAVLSFLAHRVFTFGVKG